MKPIKLTIEGLNSFIEKQIIDFEDLTSQGFFGIFGVTGSGKSSILDGITLALYGNIARKSSNYININCDRLNVNFEFEICDKRYIADREFRRKKDGGIQSGKCKLIDCDNDDVLADSVKAINKTIEAILGLSLDDFTRTVVLPQGKFSDFLRLEGKERREMLERLFNLQKYGDNLSNKLLKEINRQRNESNILNGQLMVYEDITEQNLDIKKQNLGQINNDLILLKDKNEKLDKKFRECENLWNLQLELKQYLEKKLKLKENENEYNEFKFKIKFGEASSRVLPYLKAYENTFKAFKDNKMQFDLLSAKIQNIKIEKEEIDKIYIKVKEKKDNELPKLIIEENMVSDAINEEKALENIKAKISLLLNEKEALNKKINYDSNELLQLEEEIKKYSLKYENDQIDYDKLKIDEEFKVKVQKGILIEEKISSIKQILNKNKENKEVIERDNLIILQEGKKLRSILKEKKKILDEYSMKIKSLDENCPGNQNALLDLRDLVNEAKERTNNLNKLNLENKAYENQMKNLDSEKEFKKKELEALEKELEKNKHELNKIVKENLAYTLRLELNDGDICPVCGSIHHIKENIKKYRLEDATSIEEKIKFKEHKIKLMSEAVIQYESKISLLNEKNDKNREEIIEMEKFSKEASLEELQKRFDKFENDLEIYKKEKENTEKLLNKVRNEVTEKNGEINSKIELFNNNKKQLDLINKEITDKKEEFHIYEKKLYELKQDTGIDDFKKKNEEIIKIEIKRNKLEKLLKENRKEIDKLKKSKENKNSELSISKESSVKIVTNLNLYEESKKEKIQSIKNKVGEETDLRDLLINIKKNIKDINDIYINIEERKNKIEKEYKDINEKFISVQSKDKDLTIRKNEDEINLSNAMKTEGFRDSEDVKEKLVKEELLNLYKEKVDLYNEKLSKIEGTVESLVKKINNREISDDEYESIRLLKIEEDKRYSKLNEQKIKIEEELKILEIKINEQKELLDKRKKLDHKTALLSDLEKLFKGKKFVEFVAAHQLKYVTIEASKRLKEITHGNFGIEVDENGKFIMRDYKNGGAGRDASTLSGGETFLASLSLSLALSAQIQLKGTAPLELFFLDEGFGTLDEDLLEVVMNSLERIHNDRLKIGIISHVESIKNRVPVKLVIKPAECGISGSKVRIERS